MSTLIMISDIYVTKHIFKKAYLRKKVQKIAGRTHLRMFGRNLTGV